MIYFRLTRKYFEINNDEIEKEKKTEEKEKESYSILLTRPVSVLSFVSNFHAGIPKSFGSLNSEVNR